MAKQTKPQSPKTKCAAQGSAAITLRRLALPPSTDCCQKRTAFACYPADPALPAAGARLRGVGAGRMARANDERGV